MTSYTIAKQLLETHKSNPGQVTDQGFSITCLPMDSLDGLNDDVFKAIKEDIVKLMCVDPDLKSEIVSVSVNRKEITLDAIFEHTSSR